ncbi:hypothetical protein AVEN_36734-1 [Araneus ventricosus]|uniref:Uncharacterized protein n=1 Tax=Araneus ventricosus TaxID=182803 RepID=A0A4Y2HJ47_ARAVE|nr:hypothetical protein AVEN_36734-1 [Araneus ventricosus]
MSGDSEQAKRVCVEGVAMITDDEVASIASHTKCKEKRGNEEEVYFLQQQITYLLKLDETLTNKTVRSVCLIVLWHKSHWFGYAVPNECENGINVKRN